MRNSIWAALAGAAAMVAAGQAGAAITYLWTGTVASGVDTAGTFGPAGTDLAGRLFSATYTFDPTLGTYGQFSATDTALYGGPYYGTSSPGSVVFAINSFNRMINGDVLSGVDGGVSSNGYYFSTAVNAGSYVEGLALEVAQLPVGVLPSDLTAAYSGNPCPNGVCFGVYWNGPGPNNIVLTPDHLTITPDPGSPAILVSVPEPSTWAMMILGVFSLGAVLRRQRSSALA